MDKDIRKILKAAQAQGFEVRTSRKGYPLVYTDDGKFVTKAAQTPSDRRGQRNLISALRKAGFTWPPPRR